MNDDDAEWVIFRTGDTNKQVKWVRGETWDMFVVEVPYHTCEFISRGHTIEEAMRLVGLAKEEI